MRPIRRSTIPLACALAALAVPGNAPGADATALARAVDDPAVQWTDCPGFMPKGCTLAVLHGDPAGNDADVFFRVPAGAEIPVHWHSAPERMVLVGGRLRVAHDGQAPVLLTPGMYAYGPPRAPHSATCEGADACVLFIAFGGPVDAHAGRPPR